MKNKLGISDDIQLKNLEYKVTNFKHRLIDEYFSFNEDSIFSLNYLEKLHIFLFSDLYDEEDCKIKSTVSQDSKEKVKCELDKLKTLAYDRNNINQESISNCIYNIWEEQIFLDGNTRTLRAFLKIYYLGLDITTDYDFDQDIHEDYIIDSLTKIKIKRI